MKLTSHRDIERDIRECSGLAARGSTSQTEMRFQYGYAQVVLQGRFEASTARGRKEGQGKFKGDNLPEQYDIDSGNYDDFIGWCVSILSTGRTIECGQGVGLEDIIDRTPVPGVDFRMVTIPEVVRAQGSYSDEPPWDLNPEYQRGHVWTDTQAERFIGHLCEGGEAPKIYIQRWDSPKNAPEGSGTHYIDLPPEVIDGQQRLRAILRFLDGEIAAELTDSRRLWFRDFTEIEARMLPMVRVHYVDLSQEERLRFYLKLNRGGTVHSTAEIKKAETLLAAELGMSWGAWKARQRPANFDELDAAEQWAIDKRLGILDWDSSED